MAEVTVWIEQDGSRVTYTAENADKLKAMRKAQNFLETLVGSESLTSYGTYSAIGFDIKSSDDIKFRFWFNEG